MSHYNPQPSGSFEIEPAPLGVPNVSDHYRQLVELSPDGIAIYSDGVIVYINQAGAKLLGADNADQLVGKPVMDIVHPEYREIAELRMQQVSQSQVNTELAEEKFVRLNGMEVDVEVARYPFEYQGRPAVQLVIHDITPRKRVEAEIVQRNRELTILQSTGGAITSSLDLRFILDTLVRELAELFKVESCSITHWDEENNTISLRARYDTNGWWDSNLPAVVRNLAEFPQTKWVLDEQVPHQMTIGQPNVDPAEFSYMQRQNIKTRLVLPMVFQQRVMGLVELEDTHEQRTFGYQEISLAKLLANQAASAIENAQLFEQAQQEITDRKQAEAELQEERALLAQRVAERTIELSKANAELARTARLKDEFFANMSHELRTPLNGILGSAEILITGVFGEVNEKQTRYLNNIDESGRHLVELITDILDLAKTEAGQLLVDVRPTSVDTVCQASLRMTKQIAHKKRIKVSYTPDEVLQTIPADERRLKQMLVNLLSNAIKFTPEGGQIGLDVVANAEKQIVHFTVWDNGIGIPQEQMDMLFQPFVQLDGGLTRQQGGTGLGLSLVFKMAELHGGSVSVESEVGEGSRFTITLPWPQIEEITEEENAEKPEDTAAADQPASPPAFGEAPLILLAEDNEDNITTFTDFLSAKGYRLMEARNGAEAIERALEERPALVLMDIQMPEMDGLEATRRFRGDPKLADIPIIALTALAMPGDRERCLEAGANKYVSKPVSLRNLAEIIANQIVESS
jgi:PAS domain S-box-containing protein